MTDIVKSTEWTTPDGQLLVEGTEITVRGMGRVTFHSHSLNPCSGAEWLDVFQGPRGRRQSTMRPGRWRSAATDAVTKVHR